MTPMNEKREFRSAAQIAHDSGMANQLEQVIAADECYSFWRCVFAWAFWLAVLVAGCLAIDLVATRPQV